MAKLDDTALGLSETQEALRRPPASLCSAPDVAKRWSDLAFRTQQARLRQEQATLNDELVRAAESDPAAPSAPAYRLWIADNFAAAGQWDEALKACDDVFEHTDCTEPLLPSLDIVRTARQRQAEFAASAGDANTAIAVWRALWAENKDQIYDIEGMLFAGLLAEKCGRDAEAADLYGAVAAKKEEPAQTPAQLALRALRRLEDYHEKFSPSVVAARSAILGALRDRDSKRLDAHVSRTHFAVGVVGGHFRFEDAAMRERILSELLTGDFPEGGAMLGSGNKRYLFSSGWGGELLRGSIGLVFIRAPRGWQCGGIALTELTDELLERWKPKKIQQNQPLPFTLRAPWPAGRNFMAGGLPQFAVKVAAVAAAGPLGGALLAAGFSTLTCGFGTRGFYYNDLFSHQGEDAFAIDFTRYRRGVPFDNESGGTPVLAAAPGIVAVARPGVDSGDSSASNTVAISHADPAPGGAVDRFTSQYLHLAGPNMLSVSVGMPVVTGQRLGVMNDTGTSVVDHLHFSIHDRNLPFAGSSFGASVRPSPMDGATLGDGDSGKCVLSSNFERRPPPPDDAEFVSQSVPSSLRPLEQIVATVTMRNIGPTTWTPGYKLVSLALGWTVDEVGIGQSVAEGDTVTIEIPLLSLSPGDFGFQWQMSRPFTGRFGQATPRKKVTVEDADNPRDCDALDRSLALAEAELRDWQDLLDDVPPSGKPEVVDQIKRVQGQIAGINRQKERAGCP
jgi:murein DD-endopeptidase MepM/ murein hydrolase activator NlpD